MTFFYSQGSEVVEIIKIITTTHYNPGTTDPNTGGVAIKNEQVTQSGGYSGGTMAAIDYARSQPGSGEYQAVGFMDALLGALKSPVG